jgi:hypothetical protein
LIVNETMRFVLARVRQIVHGLNLLKIII